ncbi:hypothetical protein CH341_19075 [Rhodoplanes roseus]|uniref:Glycosyltransferase RgtA/B/C/D-like domain-containing protein n=1 Tax=Rhodoplanes roseus TaxID=29409 RepID=A0A327KUE0_9BRAD|nr:hypothetical protein CH341_19075 [Rhodoplanes roseus]
MRGREAAVFAAAAAVILLVRFASRMIGWQGVPDWHGWFDQGRYLAAARAFATLDLSSAQHHYPPLYALLAAPFVWLSPNDPFIAVNLICVAVAVYALVTLFGPLIGPLGAGVFAVGFLLLPRMLIETVVVPWNSTLATALLLVALGTLMRIERDGRVRLADAAVFGTALGLLVPTRPMDAMVACLLLPFWTALVWRAVPGTAAVRLRRWVGINLVAGSAVLLGPLLLVGSNLLIHGSIGSPYMGASMMFGLDGFAVRLVSLVSDSAPLYVEPASMLIARFPWLPPALGAAALCFLYGPLWLRAAVLLSLAQILVYASYLDLLPNGLYRYLNYHYFRWSLWLLFLMMPTAAVLTWRRLGRRSWIPGAAVAALSVLIACLQVTLSGQAVGTVRDGETLRVTLPPEPVRYVDLLGLTGDWQRTYFGNARATIDGRPLAFIRDVRALPLPGGTRLVFVEPRAGGTLSLPLTGWTLASDPPSGTAGTARIGLGVPTWLRGS